MGLRGYTGLLITQYPPSCAFFPEERCWEGKTAWGSNMEGTNKLIMWEVITLLQYISRVKD